MISSCCYCCWWEVVTCRQFLGPHASAMHITSKYDKLSEQGLFQMTWIRWYSDWRPGSFSQPFHIRKNICWKAPGPWPQPEAIHAVQTWEFTSEDFSILVTSSVKIRTDTDRVLASVWSALGSIRRSTVKIRTKLLTTCTIPTCVLAWNMVNQILFFQTGTEAAKLRGVQWATTSLVVKLCRFDYECRLQTNGIFPQFVREFKLIYVRRIIRGDSGLDRRGSRWGIVRSIIWWVRISWLRVSKTVASSRTQLCRTLHDGYS